MRIDSRWPAGDSERFRTYAAELVALSPDVILATGSAAAEPLLRAARTIPVVFVVVPDPVGAGFVNSLARPGGNATGFIQFEYGISGKWLELLKQIAPRNPLTCRYRRRPSTSWSSTSRLRRCSASPYRIACSPAPTR